MATIFRDSDVDEGVLADRKVAVLGYGSQGHAHSQNLRDSGVDVRVGLAPDSKSRAKAEADGLPVMDTNDAAAEADVVMVLAPDTVQQEMWQSGLREALQPGNAIAFGHGFNIHFGFVDPSPETDVFMIAPKGPGH